MLKTGFFLLIALLLFTRIHAQVNLIDMSFPAQCKTIDSLKGYFTKNADVDFDKGMQPYINKAIEHGDEKLETLLVIHTTWYSYEKGNVTDEQFRFHLQTLITRCKKKKWDDILAIVYSQYAGYWRKKDDIPQSIKYKLLAYNTYSGFSNEYYIYKQWNVKSLGNDYYHLGDYDKAAKYLQESASLAEEFDPSIYNTLGLIQYGRNNQDSALYYFDSAYRYSVIHNKKRWKILLLGNMLEAYLRNEQYDSAIAIGNAVLSLTDSKSDIVHCRMLHAVGYVYLLKGELVRSHEYYEDALSCYCNVDSLWHYNDLGGAAVFFEEFAEVSSRLGKYREAYIYADSALVLKDSSYARQGIEELKNVEDELAKERLENTRNTLAYERTQTRMQRNLLIVTLIMAAFVVLFVINRFRYRRQKLEEEKERANYKLRLSEDKLAKFTESIHDKNTLLKNLEDKLDKYKGVEDAKDYQEKINQLKETTILTDKDWDDFKNTFDIVYPGLRKKIEDKYHDITQAELRYILLYKLGFDNKAMSSILGISTASVRTLKSRVLKKLGFDSDAELSSGLQEL